MAQTMSTELARGPLTGMRVLDIGHAEGFFSFEAERRGASEIIGVENYGPMIRKF